MTRGTTRGTTTWALGLALLCAMLCGAVGGWALAQSHAGPEAPGFVELDARVDSVEPDGLRACVSPLDPTLLERYGQICGRIYRDPGVDVASSQRMHVGWFSVVTREGSESVEAMVLSPLGR